MNEVDDLFPYDPGANAADLDWPDKLRAEPDRVLAHWAWTGWSGQCPRQSREVRERIQGEREASNPAHWSDT